MERQLFIDNVANSQKIPIDDQEDEPENQNVIISEGEEPSDGGSEGIDDGQEEESDGEPVNAANYD